MVYMAEVAQRVIAEDGAIVTIELSRWGWGEGGGGKWRFSTEPQNLGCSRFQILERPYDCST